MIRSSLVLRFRTSVAPPPSLFLRFCLISESDVPIYHPVAFYEQVGPWLGVKAGEAGSRVPAPPRLL